MSTNSIWNANHLLLTTVDKKCIHYGSNVFIRSRLRSPTNELDTICLNKPGRDTCLWTSPVDAEYDWFSWCRGNDFNIDSLDKAFEFDLQGKVYEITDDESLERLPWVEADLRVPDAGLQPAEFDPSHLEWTRGDKLLAYSCIDFEQMSHHCDAIHLTEKGLRNYRQTRCFNSWDVETMLILNPDCLKNIVHYAARKK